MAVVRSAGRVAELHAVVRRRLKQVDGLLINKRIWFAKNCAYRSSEGE